MLPFYWIDLEPLSFFIWIRNAFFISIYCGLVIIVINWIFDKETIRNALNRIVNVIKSMKSEKTT